MQGTATIIIIIIITTVPVIMHWTNRENSQNKIVQATKKVSKTTCNLKIYNSYMKGQAFIHI